ncbi:OmpA family protein [Marinobacter sp. F4206]|uniref:OmpA family protein n=1 Tax=Marinobacter sp. F4206 TaxID=2861777 RepID=UPI001C5DBEB3|nr:OmpA family protein [Marinobacter sp. F4206]MBW4934747.1 OmpA family protein [Marinobacter sp. F4206]
MDFMRSCAMAVIASALVAPAIAAERKDTFYINPFAAYQYFDDKRDLSESDTYGVGLEYRFAPRWSLEPVYSRANVDRKNAVGESDFDEIRLDATYYFAGPDETWNPYVSLGGGHADFGDDANGPLTSGSNHDETRVNVGTGFRYNLSDSLSLRADLREFHGIDESTFDTQVSLGLSFAFFRTVAAPADADGDGVPDDADECPGTPAGATVDSTGCEPDADRDGVADARDECPDTTLGAEVDSRGCEPDSDNDGVIDGVDQCPSTTPGATVDERGCEGVTEVIQTFEVDVQFANNSSVINNAYDEDLRRVADFLKENPRTFVEVAGHTDSVGDADYNQFLSLRRAEAVAARLVDSLGVDPSRVKASGYGEEQPIARNDTAEGRAANRRVEALIQVER